VVLCCLAAATSSQACEHGAHGPHKSVWDREQDVQGRSRTLLSFQGRKCGARAMSPAEVETLAEVDALYQAQEAGNMANIPKGPDGIKTYVIPTYVTVVVANDGTGMGDVKDAAIKAQLDALNAAYSKGSDKAGLRWYYQLMEIKRVTGPDMCDTANEAKMKAMHRKGGKGALNLFITDLSACGLLGYSTWPWDLAKGPKVDGVVIHYDTLPVIGKYAPYNLGRTAIHEIGHWMGLYHTFQNGCGKGGDMVDDTPYTASPTEGCPRSRDSCSQVGSDPIHNFMDYADDKCMFEFTAGQQERMEMVWSKYRTELQEIAITGSVAADTIRAVRKAAVTSQQVAQLG